MVKLLSVVALYKTCLGSVCLNLDDDMAKAGQIEDFQRFFVVGGRHQEWRDSSILSAHPHKAGAA